MRSCTLLYRTVTSSLTKCELRLKSPTLWSVMRRSISDLGFGTSPRGVTFRPGRSSAKGPENRFVSRSRLRNQDVIELARIERKGWMISLLAMLKIIEVTRWEDPFS